MKIALGQINPIIGDFVGNCRKIRSFTEQALQRGAGMIVFPEMAVSGYPPMDLLDYDGFVRENLKALRSLQRDIPGEIAVVLGYIDRNRSHSGRPLQNVVSILLGGKIVHTQAKTLLPSYDVFDETRYFEPAKERTTFRYQDLRIGIAICEDIWWEVEPVPGTRYPIDPVKELLNLGANLILVPSASPYFHGKVEVRKKLVTGIGSSSSVPVVYVNQVGGNDSLIFDGHSFVTDERGEIVCACDGFSEGIFLWDSRQKHNTVILDVEKYEAVYRALTLGLKDYLKKCGFSHVHLGLSGGIDSALVAVLAVEAVGREKVKAFALPTRYSSEGSLRDAKRLADNLGIELSVVSIEELFIKNLEVLAPLFMGKPADVTEENLQARIRGTLLMAYSNKWNSLLLTTGNKSELAVGYCTLYGDMCGGLSVIGDLFKTEVYDLCRYLNQKNNLIPVEIIEKAPSAELRPNQTDQDSLPPYEVLDRILELHLLEQLSGEEIVAKGFSEDLVIRIHDLVSKAEYKRRQAPPVLKISPRAFGTGRRIPIARFYK